MKNKKFGGILDFIHLIIGLNVFYKQWSHNHQSIQTILLTKHTLPRVVTPHSKDTHHKAVIRLNRAILLKADIPLRVAIHHKAHTLLKAATPLSPLSSCKETRKSTWTTSRKLWIWRESSSNKK